MIPQTMKCPVCGRPYKVYSHYAGDQTACPECRREAEEDANLSREEYFRKYPQRRAERGWR